MKYKNNKFPVTSWSLLGRACSSDDAVSYEAMTGLLNAYLPALKSYLLLSKKINEDEVNEILQGFVTDKILAASLLAKVDKTKGKFRNYLLKSLNNYFNSCYSKNKKYTNVSDEDISEPGIEEEDIFDKEWVKQVVVESLQKMECYCIDKNKILMWDVFRLRFTGPILNNEQPMPYNKLIAELNISTPKKAMELLANGKRCFIKQVKKVIRQYVKDEALVEEEINDLRIIIMK